MEQITANISGSVRREKLHGREYLVAPLSLIVPGILNGSNGPLLYSEAELQNDPSRWNSVPIVLGHPTEQGRPLSARSPNVLEKYQLGYVFNALYDGKLRAEGWFDVQLVNSVAPEIYGALTTSKPLELSTGLSGDYDWTAGTRNGNSYKGMLKNFRPDHLAILLHDRGACSLQDGCGVNVNAESSVDADNEPSDKENNMSKETDPKVKKLVDSLIANCNCYEEGDREVLNSFSVERLESLNEHVKTHNELVANKAQADEAIADAAKEGAKGLKQSEHEEDQVTTNSGQEPPKPKTTDEWLKGAPAEVQSVVRNAMAAEKKQKDSLIEKITANERNTFTEDHLLMKDVQELEAIAAIAEVPQAKGPPLYTGAVGGVATTNKDRQTEEEEPLPLPTINWAEKSA